MTTAPVRTWKKRGYVLSTDPAKLDMDFVHRALAASYWSPSAARAWAAG